MPEQDKIKSAANEAAETAKAMAQDAVETARNEAQARADAAKEGVAKDVKSVASALRDASEEMRSGTPQERAVGQIAGTLADVSDAIRDQDLGDMVNSMSSFARKNPVMFLSSAALLGFAAARFAKASDSGQPGGSGSQGSSYGSHGGYGAQGSTAGSAQSSSYGTQGGSQSMSAAAPGSAQTASRQSGTPAPAINRGEN
ncbi:hypothetical protein [Cribrihabitans neustonicus]|uniref:hypothetical protein n=1 Tax=Cribrihabitans neustonicus TaxID=1429085 RepID=UPI003B58E972